MSPIQRALTPLFQLSARTFAACRAGASLAAALMVIAVSGTMPAQTTANLFGTSIPANIDSGELSPVVLGVKVFSDVPGQVLGCSFYKSSANIGAHVVSLWDSTGKLLATQAATAETASGKQTVMFPSPVAIAANQLFTCGYYAPLGHWSYDRPAFTVQTDVAPLHIPANGGVYVYGTQATQWPTGFSQRNYWVDVVFAPARGNVLNLDQRS